MYGAVGTECLIVAGGWELGKLRNPNYSHPGQSVSASRQGTGAGVIPELPPSLSKPCVFQMGTRRKTAPRGHSSPSYILFITFFLSHFS